MVTTLQSYTLFNRQLEAKAPEPSTDRAVEDEVKYWRENIRNITSTDDFVNNPRLYNFATRAFGYKDNAPQPIITQLAIEFGSSDASAPANTRNDPRFTDMIRQFAFSEFGGRSTRDPFFISNIEQRYRAAVAEETRASRAEARTTVDTQAARRDDYFRTRISTIETADELVGDLQLYKYALRAYGLEDYVNTPFQIKQVLTEGADDETDLANLLGDQRLKIFTEAFAFSDPDGSNLDDAQFVNDVVTRHQRATGAIKTVSREGESTSSAYFRENIGKISTSEELLADQRLYTYVMTAFDLNSEIDKRGIVAKVLEEGAADREDLANRLPDPRFRKMAEVLGFAEFRASSIRDPGIIDQIVDRYERVQAEIDAGLENPAVELAAYFDRKSEGITNWIQVIADTRLREVVFSTLDVPDAIFNLSVEKMAEELESRYPIADFQDPQNVEDFLKRYMTLNDIENASATSFATNPALVLLQGATSSFQSLYSLVARL